MESGEPKTARSAHALAALSVAAWAVTAATLLYCSFTLFTWFRYQINDQGIYTNFLWNSAHGQPFRYLMGQSYLSVHLSFTLLLLAPLFHVWDHPYLLCVVQWIAGVGGSLLAGWIARRSGLRGPLPAVLMLFFLAYPFTQSVLLCDFHGVCLYYVLFPALYACLRFRRGWAWLPVVLIAGLREEAALLVVPMLAWFAARERWRGGWILAGLALLYAAFALLVLFPQLNDMHLLERRSNYFAPSKVVGTFTAAGFATRAVALAWFFLPAVLIARRRAWLPVLVFPSVALLIPMFSAVPRINSLSVMYSAAPFALLVLALIEVLRLRAASGRLQQPLRPGLLLASATLVAVLAAEFAPDSFDRRRDLRHWRVNPDGLDVVRVARAVPADGPLYTTRSLAGLCANRRDLLVYRSSPAPQVVQYARYVLAENTSLARGDMGYWVAQLGSGAFGVLHHDAFLTLMGKGAATDRNAEALRTIQGVRPAKP